MRGLGTHTQLRSNCIKSQDRAEEGSQASFGRALSSPSVGVSSPSRAASSPSVASRSDSAERAASWVELGAGDGGLRSKLPLRRQASLDAVANLTINTGTSLVPDPPTTCAAAAEGVAAVEGLEGGDKDEDDEASDWDESDDWSDEEDLEAFELEVASFLAAVKHQSRSHARSVHVSPNPVLLPKRHSAHVLKSRLSVLKDAPVSAQHSRHTHHH